MIIIPYEVSDVIHNFESVKLYKFKWNCPKGDHKQGFEVVPSIEMYGGPNHIQKKRCARCGNDFNYRIIEDNKYGYVLQTLEEDKK